MADTNDLLFFSNDTGFYCSVGGMFSLLSDKLIFWLKEKFSAMSSLSAFSCLGVSSMRSEIRGSLFLNYFDGLILSGGVGGQDSISTSGIMLVQAIISSKVLFFMALYLLG